jgi:molybdopterin converting factor small subunit
VTARLRLFANLRELAGSSSFEVAGSTVAEVLEEAIERFGPEFEEALAPAQVWVDGGALVVQSPIVLEIGIFIALAIGLFIANAISLEWFAVASVLAAGLWVFDATGAADRRGLPLASTPIILAAAAGAVATYRFGGLGMSAATAGAVMVTLIWSVMSPYLRSVDSFAAGVTLAGISALGTSALVFLRLRSREETLVFLFILTVAVLVSWVSDRSEVPILDPMVALIVGGVLAGAVGGALWAPDLLNAVAGAVAAAIALVAGRNLGMLLRLGGIFAQGPLPGSLAYLDGGLLAAGAYWAMLTILT